MKSSTLHFCDEWRRRFGAEARCEHVTDGPAMFVGEGEVPPAAQNEWARVFADDGAAVLVEPKSGFLALRQLPENATREDAIGSLRAAKAVVADNM